MTPEERLYTLMAHAEDLQKHAQTLQTRTKTAIEGLPGIVREAGDEIRAQSTRWIGFGVAILLAVGIIMGAGVSAYIRHDVGSLRGEADALRAEIAEMQHTEAELVGKMWGLKLKTWGNERGIILPQGVKVVRTGPLSDHSGRIGIIIAP